MATDNPYPCPAPLVLADLSATRAWDNDVHDYDRRLHEWNADTHRLQSAEIHRLWQRCEQLEAENETYARALYGPNQKGGAA